MSVVQPGQVIDGNPIINNPFAEPTRYWHFAGVTPEVRKGRRIAKVVTFFLCDYRSGSLDDHDHEVERAWWSSLPEAAAVLSYEGEREMTVRALHLLTATG